MNMDLPAILIYNPDEEMTARMASILRFHGFVVMTSQDPEELFSLFFEQQPDVVMIAAQDDQTGGFSLVNKFRSQPLTASTPVVVTSSADFAMVEQQARHLWCAYLEEPFDTGILMEAIENALRNPPTSIH